ncbi:MAG: hypothetical protein IPI67_09670 [Myxococcales bacterium]|nr:hypothetical protein [Myxococcales bacterium]
MRWTLLSLLGCGFALACSSAPGRDGPSGAAGGGGSAAGAGAASGGSAGAGAAGSGGVSGAAGGGLGGDGTGATGGSLGSGGGAGGGGGGGGGSAWGPAQCPAAPSNIGFDVGDTLGELVVKDCDTGAVATLDELCGAAATWVFVAHTHCPTCKATAGFTDSVAAAVADQDVAIAHIVYDDNGTSCATWKASFELSGIKNVKLFEDPTGAAWSKLKTSNYTAPSAFLDKNRVITFKAHGLTESSVLGQITQALAN